MRNGTHMSVRPVVEPRKGSIEQRLHDWKTFPGGFNLNWFRDRGITEDELGEASFWIEEQREKARA